MPETVKVDASASLGPDFAAARRVWEAEDPETVVNGFRPVEGA